MKTIKDHLGHIILSVAAVALIVGVVLAFAAPVGNFFDSIIEKTNEQAQGNIWDLGEYGGAGGSGSGGAGNVDEQEEPGVIKAGTYRFNDELTIPDEAVSEEVWFTANIGADSSILAECLNINVATIYGETGVKLAYYVYNLDPNPGFEVPNLYDVHTTTHGWYTDSYGEGIQTITVPYDQDVSDEFDVWFKANTKRVIEVDEIPTQNINTNAIYKTYEYLNIDNADPATIKAGTYRFNDVLTVSNSNITQAVNFTTSPAYDENFTPTEGTMVWTSITVEGTYTPQVSYTGNAGGVPVYNGTNDYCWNYFNLVLGASVLDERIQTITVTEDADVSDEFGTWFAANAKQRVEKYYQYVNGTWVEYGEAEGSGGGSR